MWSVGIGANRCSVLRSCFVHTLCGYDAITEDEQDTEGGNIRAIVRQTMIEVHMQYYYIII